MQGEGYTSKEVYRLRLIRRFDLSYISNNLQFNVKSCRQLASVQRDDIDQQISPVTNVQS